MPLGVSTARSKKVVFFFPAFSSQEATAPLGILAVATPLLRAGYQVKIIDSTITPNFQRRVMEELNDALCLAVSLVTGPMIRETCAVAREVKRLYPNMPIVLGGWHPSLLPDQTLAADFVDAVVVGIHWGQEYEAEADAEQIDLAKQIGAVILKDSG